ncbi:MAG: prolipoprotein diacylglyceryl transferase [Clostridiales bacterium]|jgi:phosphatidylglycerol:prolipoprotein diacylglycerol transferase|nr:prolipoprotein diacylglyceryl transferase [Clostridiales bacterium]
MFPILLQFGNFAIYAYGVMLALAFAIGVFGLTREARKAGLNEDKMLEMTIWIIVAALVGSRVLYILIELPVYLADPLSVFAVRSGGLSFHGGLAGGILAGLIYTRRHKLPQGIVADLVAPYLALGYAIVRIGCLLNGCCFGRPTGVPWALPSAYLDSTPRHPTQLYAFLASLLIFFILLYRKQKIRFHGQLFMEFIVLYSIYRFFIEFYRDATLLVGFLTLGQIASIIAAVGAYVAIRLWPFGRREKA